jgi:hypothetical protein
MRAIAGVPAGNVAFCKPGSVPMVSNKSNVRGKPPTSLDGVYRCVRKWAHGTGYEANNHVLVGRKLRQFWLLLVGKFLQLLIRSEVRSCVVYKSVSSTRAHARASIP